MNALKLKLYQHFPSILQKEIRILIQDHNEKIRLSSSEPSKLEQLLMVVSSDKLIAILEKNHCNFTIDRYTPEVLKKDKRIVDRSIKKNIYSIYDIPEDMITDEYLQQFENFIQNVKGIEFLAIPFPKKFFSSEIIMNAYFKWISKDPDKFVQFLNMVSEYEDLLKKSIEFGIQNDLFVNISYHTLNKKVRKRPIIMKELLSKGYISFDLLSEEEINIIEPIFLNLVEEGNYHWFGNFDLRFFQREKVIQTLLKHREKYWNIFKEYDASIFSKEELEKIILSIPETDFSLNFFPKNFYTSKNALLALIKLKKYSLIGAFDEEILNEIFIPFLLKQNRDEIFEIIQKDSSSILIQNPHLLYYFLNDFQNMVQTTKDRKEDQMNSYFHKYISIFLEQAYSQENMDFMINIMKTYSLNILLPVTILNSETILKKFIHEGLNKEIFQFSESTFSLDLVDDLFHKLSYEEFMSLPFIKSHLHQISSLIKIQSIEEFNHFFDHASRLDEEQILFLLQKYNESGLSYEKGEVYKKYFTEKIKNTLGNIFDKNTSSIFVDRVLNGTRNPFSLSFIKNNKDLEYATYIFDVNSTSVQEYITTLPNEIFNKINKKHISEICRLLKELNVLEKNIIRLGIHIYLSLGFERSIDFLSKNPKKNYGVVHEAQLLKIFDEIRPIDIEFISSGKGYIPQLNETWIHLIFGESNKIKNTPIRNYLNFFSDKKEEIERQKEKINKNLSLTSEEKQDALRKIDRQFQEYQTDIYQFFDLAGRSFNEWDIVEEEFLKTKNKTKFKIKLNISKVNELLKIINNKRKMPSLEPRDEALLSSDIFEYVGYDTQFTYKPEQAPARAVELSRKMEGVFTKKFPNVHLQKGTYHMDVFHPQDRNMISAGYRCGCCFRPNGNADNMGENNSLLTYCASTLYGGGIEMKDNDGKTIMFAPIMRNGNVLMIHSVETKCDYLMPDECYDLLKDFAYKMIEESYKVGDTIDFVTITDLHHLDHRITEGTLPIDKKFPIYDENHQYDRMYHNLDCNHMIIATSGKKVEDITYGAVNYSYDYPKVDPYHYIGMTENEIYVVQELDLLHKKIVSLGNQRNQALKEGNEEVCHDLLRKIKENKKQFLKQYHVLLEQRKGLDFYYEFHKASNVIEYVGNIIPKDDLLKIREISFGSDWYIVITSDERCFCHCLATGKKDLQKYLNQIKNTRNIHIEDEILFENENKLQTIKR